MSNTAKVFVAGVIGIGLITAFGMHASGLAQLASSVGKSASQVEGTAIRG